MSLRTRLFVPSKRFNEFIVRFRRFFLLFLGSLRFNLLVSFELGFARGVREGTGESGEFVG